MDELQKKIAMISAIFFTIILTGVGCKSKKDDYESFLGLGTSEKKAGDPALESSATAENSGPGPSLLEGESSEEKGRQKKSTLLTIGASEWDALIKESARLKAELRARDIDTDSRLRAEYERGLSEGVARSDKRLAVIREELLDEASRRVDGLNKKLLIYQSRSAIVTGNCMALTKTGESFLYAVHNECLSLVNKNINSHGVITGIKDAVSKKAQDDEGILKLDCTIEDANFRFLQKPCPR